MKTDRHKTFYLTCGAADAPPIVFVHERGAFVSLTGRTWPRNGRRVDAKSVATLVVEAGSGAAPDGSGAHDAISTPGLPYAGASATNRSPAGPGGARLPLGRRCHCIPSP